LVKTVSGYKFKKGRIPSMCSPVVMSHLCCILVSFWADILYSAIAELNRASHCISVDSEYFWSLWWELFWCCEPMLEHKLTCFTSQSIHLSMNLWDGLDMKP